MKYRLLNLRTAQKDKKPKVEQLEFGELSVNYNSETPKILFKNDKNEVVSISDDNYNKAELDKKQNVLVSGENIKTFNGNSLLGKGNIVFENITYTGKNGVVVSGNEITLDTEVIALKDDINQLEENIQDVNEKIPNLFQKITYNELVNLKNTNNLIPGQTYRITDYITTSTQSETQAAGHKFDLIVKANSENSISENASAIKSLSPEFRSSFSHITNHSISPNSWSSCDTPKGIREKIGENIDTKSLFFTLKNGIEKDNVLVSTVNYTSGNNKMNLLGVDLRDSSGNVIASEYHVGSAGLEHVNNTFSLFIPQSGDNFKIYFYINSSEEPITANGQINIFEGEDYFKNNDLSSWEIKYSLDNDTTRFAWADSENGKGVIYYMKDEFNNEAWYDFKNIKFLRSREWISQNAWFTPLNNITSDVYLYTFSRNEGSQGFVDDSLGTGKYPTSDNHLGHSTASIPKLNNTVFIGNGTFANTLGDGHSNNTFGSNCYNNFVGTTFTGNIVNNNFLNNVIDSNVKHNNFKLTFSENSVGAVFSGNNVNYVSCCEFGKYIQRNNFEINEGSSDKIICCKFGNNVTNIKDIPSSMNKVTFEDYIFTSNENYLGECILNNGLTAKSQLSSNLIEEEKIFYRDGSGQFRVECKSDKYFLIEENTNKINRLNKNIYYLSQTFTNSGDAENAAKNPNIATNKDIIFIHYKVGDKNGLIRQEVFGLTTHQFITWDGVEKKRTLTFSDIFGGLTLIGETDWEFYYIRPNEFENTQKVVSAALNELNKQIIQDVGAVESFNDLLENGIYQGIYVGANVNDNSGATLCVEYETFTLTTYNNKKACEISNNQIEHVVCQVKESFVYYGDQFITFKVKRIKRNKHWGNWEIF
jgi:hypothetical protein